MGDVVAVGAEGEEVCKSLSSSGVCILFESLVGVVVFFDEPVTDFVECCWEMKRSMLS